MLNQYSPVPRARSLIAGKARAQIYAGLGRVSQGQDLVRVMVKVRFRIQKYYYLRF